MDHPGAVLLRRGHVWHADHGPDGGKQPGKKKRGGDDGCRRKWKAGL